MPALPSTSAALSNNFQQRKVPEAESFATCYAGIIREHFGTRKVARVLTALARIYLISTIIDIINCSMNKKSTQRTTQSVHHSLGYWTTLIARTMEADFNKRLSGYGITRVAGAVLGAIHFDEKKTPSELAAFLRIDRAAVTRLLDKLETQELIERNRTGCDRRSVSLLVTPRGKKLSATIAQESRAVNAQFATGLSPEDIEQYIETIKKILANGRETVETL